jgi:drug/metabolite transporter (DMT)-like permease
MVPFFLTDLPPVKGSDIIWIIGAGFIPGFLGILFAVMALEKLPAATFGTLAYFEPIFVVILGWAVFDETLNALQLAGCLLIIGSGVVKGYCTIQPQRQKQCEV